MAADTAPSLRRPFRAMGALLAVGLVAAVAAAAVGITGPGLFTLEQAVVGLAVAVLATAAILVTVLFRIGDVLEQLRAVQKENRLIRSQLSGTEERQHVLTIEGIGPKYASRLNQIGIITVPQLIDADVTAVAAQIGCTADLVAEWQSMGRLIGIRGIGPQYAELLVRSGIATVAQLARSEPASLKATIDLVQSQRKTAIQKGEIGEGTVRRWVEAAGQHLHDRVVRVPAATA